MVGALTSLTVHPGILDPRIHDDRIAMPYRGFSQKQIFNHLPHFRQKL
jgi:hypothetical protein